MSEMIGIGFQGSSVGMKWMPEWEKGDGMTRVIWVAIYAEAGHLLFVFSDQIRGVNRVSRLPSVIAFWISFPLDQELESFVSPKVAVCLD